MNLNDETTPSTKRNKKQNRGIEEEEERVRGKRIMEFVNIKTMKKSFIYTAILAQAA